MKTIIKILLLSLLFIGCIPDEVITETQQELNCDCVTREYIKIDNTYQWTGQEVKYYSNDCTKDNLILTELVVEGVQTMYKVTCK
jgi:serine protease inhibitor